MVQLLMSHQRLIPFCEVLPRLPSQSELVPLKLKRKVAYRGHYMYDYIRPQKLMDALRYLKEGKQPPLC